MELNPTGARIVMKNANPYIIPLEAIVRHGRIFYYGGQNVIKNGLEAGLELLIVLQFLLMLI